MCSKVSLQRQKSLQFSIESKENHEGIVFNKFYCWRQKCRLEAAKSSYIDNLISLQSV